MRRKSVAVLDVRSSEVTVLVGERGVNNTFVFKASHTEPYGGYEGGAFFDTEEFAEAVHRCVASVEKTCNERLRSLYVGVPGEFVMVRPQENRAGYTKKRKITPRETEALSEGGVEQCKGYRFIRAASVVYITGDNRRVVDPVGLFSSSLYGVFAYFYCTDYFAGTLESVFAGMKIELTFLPAEYASAVYLIPAETRDESALFLDSDFLTTTVSVVLGGGVIAQRTFDSGRGQIIFRLMKRFSLPYGAAAALLPRANLYVKEGAGTFEFLFDGVLYEIDRSRLAETVEEGLDDILEGVSAFLDEIAGEIDRPVYVTGAGVTDIRGALEHITKRLSRVTELVGPDLPYYNKPAMSSRIALLAMATGDDRNGSFHRFSNVYGG